MDKFLVTNRLKNLGVITDMNSIRQVFLKVQDLFTSLDHFILETYVLPSGYPEMSRRIIKERISLEIDDSSINFKRKGGKELVQKKMHVSQHVWVLSKQTEGKEGGKTFVVDPDD